MILKMRAEPLSVSRRSQYGHRHLDLKFQQASLNYCLEYFQWQTSIWADFSAVRFSSSISFLMTKFPWWQRMPINKDGLHLETHLPSNALANVENYPSSEQPSSKG